MSALADPEKKPDGVWILQINADRYDFSGRVIGADGAGGALWHRRDTLSGNLSLNQEVAFIEAVNARMQDPAQRARAHDRTIEVVRIVMDGDAVGGALHRELGLFSKFDRDAGLARALLAHGREQAERYLALRAQADSLWQHVAAQVGMLGARPSSRLEHALPFMAGAGRMVDALVAPGAITIEGAADGGARATLRWQTSQAELDGRTVRIKGSTALTMADGQWRAGETRLLDVQECSAPMASARPGPPPARSRRTGPRPGDGASTSLH